MSSFGSDANPKLHTLPPRKPCRDAREKLKPKGRVDDDEEEEVEAEEKGKKRKGGQE